MAEISCRSYLLAVCFIILHLHHALWIRSPKDRHGRPQSPTVGPSLEHPESLSRKLYSICAVYLETAAREACNLLHRTVFFLRFLIPDLRESRRYLEASHKSNGHHGVTVQYVVSHERYNLDDTDVTEEG
jgi:hypothetical protein